MHIAEGFLLTATRPGVDRNRVTVRGDQRASDQSPDAAATANQVVIGGGGGLCFCLVSAQAAIGDRELFPCHRHWAGAMLFGPSIMAVLGAIVLDFSSVVVGSWRVDDAGANVFSMAVVGPWIAYGLFRRGARSKPALGWQRVFSGDAGRSGYLYDVCRTVGLGFPRSSQRHHRFISQILRSVRTDPITAGRYRGVIDGRHRQFSAEETVVRSCKASVFAGNPRRGGSLVKARKGGLLILAAVLVVGSVLIGGRRERGRVRGFRRSGDGNGGRHPPRF